MSKLTFDEAIKHCLEVAEEQIRLYSLCPCPCDGTKDCMSLKNGKDMGCTKCAADHRQLAEWLTDYKKLRDFDDKVYDVLAKQFGCPCNCNYAVDAYMRKNGGCDDCGVEISDKECWSRYIQTKLIGDERNEP